MRLKGRIEKLEGERAYLTIGELLDSLDGAALPADKSVSPATARALEALPNA
jgi:hypothetical protein